MKKKRNGKYDKPIKVGGTPMILMMIGGGILGAWLLPKIAKSDGGSNENQRDSAIVGALGGAVAGMLLAPTPGRKY